MSCFSVDVDSFWQLLPPKRAFKFALFCCREYEVELIVEEVEVFEASLCLIVSRAAHGNVLNNKFEAKSAYAQSQKVCTSTIIQVFKMCTFSFVAT